MIAYELGMAADTLAQQADRIEARLDEAPAHDERSGDGDTPEPNLRRQLAEYLDSTSRLLHETAQAIVRNLK
jgi:hypothetical protein